jgi:hypothetical protein
MNGRCCVFQPFDKGPFDKRYEDTIAPAIRSCELEPYRVDRDETAVIPVDTLHEEIRSATVCLADITTRNPNVMYELGYAIASGKDVVIISALNPPERFPFDIQHRGIIQYTQDSVSDFEKLKSDISNRIRGVLRRQQTTQDVSTASVVRETHGLQPREIATLALILASTHGSEGVSGPAVQNDMEKAGYNRQATRLSLIKLARLGFIEDFEDTDYNESHTWTAYRLLKAGEDWLLANADQLELRMEPRDQTMRPKKPGIPFIISDDDVPF